MSKKEEIGFVTVDSGQLMVGDPCYYDVDYEFADHDENGTTILNHEKGPGKGVVVGTAFGDGIYPVYMKRDKYGVPLQLVVDLQGPYKGLSKAIAEKKD